MRVTASKQVARDFQEEAPGDRDAEKDSRQGMTAAAASQTCGRGGAR